MIVYQSDIAGFRQDTAGVSIEFQLPLASKRIDFILSGMDTAGKEQVVIVELKQWEHLPMGKQMYY